ncbi:MAG: PAS domain S-box protein [Methanoregulaceae archaeon]|jgi:PAS domain S-box-containing protein
MIEKRSILIVEDERITAEDMKETLLHFGYHVPAIASTGESAVEKAGELRPDLILMDIFLAGKMTGIEAAEQIGKQYDIPIIFLTAFADLQITERAKITGAYGYILKPYNERELQIAIEIAFYKSEMNKKLKKLNEELESRVKERTESLNQQVLFLQQLIDTIPSPIYYKDKNCKYIGCNIAFEDYTGIKKSNIINKTDADIFPAEIAEISQTKDTSLLKHLGIQVYQTKFFHTDQTTREVLFKKATFDDTRGSVAGLIGVMLDITDRIRAEEALKESENRFREVVQDQTELICRFLPDRTVLFANDAFLNYFHRNAKDTMGYIFKSVVHPEDAQQEDNHFRSLTPNQPVSSIEHRIILQDGTIRWQQLSVRAFFDINGYVTGYQTVGRDITEYKEIEERQRETIQQIENNLQQFAILNDHIRNPLSVIVMLTEMEGGKNVQKILEQTREIDQIINRLDQGWLESEKIRHFLSKYYGIKGITKLPPEKKDT